MKHKYILNMIHLRSHQSIQTQRKILQHKQFIEMRNETPRSHNDTSHGSQEWVQFQVSRNLSKRQTTDECERLEIMSQEMQRCKWMKT